MKIFISWSGKKSKKIAYVVESWLQDVIQAVDPFLSEQSIEKGESGLSKIESALSEYAFSIIILASDNVNAPWIHYEAGAISKGLGVSRVCPLLFGIRTSDLVSNPLHQFQCTIWNDREDLFRLISTINKNLDYGQLSDDKLQKSFEKHYEEYIENINQASVCENVEGDSAPSTEESLERITMLLEDLSERMNKMEIRERSLADSDVSNLKDVFYNQKPNKNGLFGSLSKSVNNKDAPSVLDLSGDPDLLKMILDSIEASPSSKNDGGDPEELD